MIFALPAQKRRNVRGPLGRATAICNHLGIQDAPRKMREVLRSPGPWAGSMVYTDYAEAELVSTKNWAKTKCLLARLHGLLLAP
jgi:hypothetical protein